MNQFTLTVSISCSDAQRKAAIEQAFIDNFGDIAEGETREHFVSRKTEAWILQVYANKAAEQARATVHENTLAEIHEAASIKKAPEAKEGK